MVIRFQDTVFRAAELRDAVNWSYVHTLGPEGCVEGDVMYTPFVIKQHIYLLDNFDLYIDDDFDDEIAGMFMHTMRTRGFLGEKAETIVPRVYKDTKQYVPPFLMRDTTSDDDASIERFEDHLPDTAWDDGKFEEEMNNILNNPHLFDE